MDFLDRIHALSTRIREVRPHATTEETTKAALINPFLQVLGYDPTDPRVVVMEFTADVGIKKGEKVDYAVKRDGQVIFLIEAKSADTPLNAAKASQLHRYFHNAPTARLAILTNGIRYEFFSDLDKPNVMDDKPFMVFDFDQIEEALIPELKKLANDSFDVDVALSAAQDLKHLRQIKQIIRQEMEQPTDALVKHIAAQVLDCHMRVQVIEDFRPKVIMAFEHCINDVLLQRIQGVARPNSYAGVMPQEQADSPTDATAPEAAQAQENTEKSPIETTQEELEGYFMVKAILREIIDPARVTMRDRQSYCGILLDDNGRKPICRLHFNSSAIKYLGTFDAEKNETRNKIESLDDIYQYAETLLATVTRYQGE